MDHGSIIYKFYVLGEKVFYAVKKSMPNAKILLSDSEKNACAPILFDRYVWKSILADIFVFNFISLY